jgi:hypothetical protein
MERNMSDATGDTETLAEVMEEIEAELSSDEGPALADDDSDDCGDSPLDVSGEEI